MANFSIKDLSEFSGIKQHTIRVWEQRYSFLQPQRSGSAHRSYTADELNVLLDAALLNQNGYKVSLIDKMTFEKKLQIFSRMVDQQQRFVHQLIISMAKMDVAAFEMVLENAVHTWGIHTAIQQVLIPFCEKVGLFQNGNNKNYIENIILIRQSIRNKMVMGIEKSKPAHTINKTVLLFSGQVQDLPVLHLQYMLKMHGFSTVNLGQQVAADQLEMICTHTKPDYIILHMGRTGNGIKGLDAVVERICHLPHKPLVVSIGQALANLQDHPGYACITGTNQVLEMLLEKEIV